MLIKIVEIETPENSPMVEQTFECDWITRKEYKSPDSAVAFEDTLYVFASNGVPNRWPMELWLRFWDGRAPVHIVLDNALVYVMNTGGQTVDRYKIVQ